jgi:hypothetical protein
MTDSNKSAPFKTAFGLLTKTTPFLLLNIAVYGGFFLAAVVWLAIFGSIAYFFSSRLEIIAYVFFIIAVAGPSGVLYYGRKYVLYLVKGAHIAVLTKLFTEGKLPDDKKQVSYGREVVQANFKDVSILFGVDRLIDGTVKRFTRKFVRIVDFLPLGGGATSIAKWIAKIVNQSLTYVDEAILSYAICRDEKNIWNSARHGIILYAQSYKPVLMTAVKVWIFGKVFFVASVVTIGVPGLLLMLVFDAIWFQLLALVATLLLASLFTRAVFEPFAMAYTLVTYHQAIEGVEVNKEWDERLQNISDEFKKLVSKAKDFTTGSSSETTTESSQPV